MKKVDTYKCLLVKDGGSFELPSIEMRCFDQVKAALQFMTNDSPVELFVLFHLNGRSEVIGAEVLAKGGQHGCALQARDILRSALASGASAFVVGHNHPSGDPTPSREDIAMTQALVEASEVIGLPFLDHVIVARNSDQATSLFEIGVLLVK